MVKQIFVNLPVKDLKKSMDFFKKLGFSFNEKFTDENAACLIIDDNIYSMLLTEPFFKTFIKTEINDAKKNTEVLIAITAESRKKVDEMINKAIEAGGSEQRDPQDHGWMYGRSFQDLDGHIWEVFYMDENAYNKS